MRHRMLLAWALAFAAGDGTWALGARPGWLFGAAAALGVLCLALAGRRWAVAVVGITLTGIAAGALRLAAFQMIPVTDLSRLADRAAPVTIVGTIVGDPEARLGGRVTFPLRAEQVATFRRTAPVTGIVYVSLPPVALQNVPAPDYGDRLALDGHLETPQGATNPGAFSWRDYLARRAIYCQLRVKRPDAVQRLGGSALNPFLRLAWHVRRQALAAIKASLPPTRAAVLSGILLGKRTDLPPDLMADFVHTSTVHILASAGLHVGIVAFWLLLLCERLTLPRKVTALIIILLLWLYALMAGGRPSVTRAVLMATVYFGAILFEREPDLPTTVAFAALIVLLLQPAALLEPGFQMSFLTVGTLAVTMPLWDRFWRQRLEASMQNAAARKIALWMMEMLGLSLLAQLGALPIVASAYNQVSLSGPLANALVVPALFLLIPLGFLGALVWGLWHAAGLALFGLVGIILQYVVTVVRWLGEARWSYCAIVMPPAALIALYYALVYGGTYACSRRLAAPAARAGDGGDTCPAAAALADRASEA